MNLILLENSEIDNGKTFLSDRRAEHVRSVLKASAGDLLKVGIHSGPKFEAEVVEISDVGVSLVLGNELPQVPHSNIDLILALPRPQTLKKVLETSAAMGVRKIFLTRAARVEKSFFQSSVLERGNIEKHLILGMEQAGSTFMPEVVVFERFNELRDMINTAGRGGARPLREHVESIRLIAEPSSSQDILTFKNNFTPDIPITLAVGPEGGWVEHEIEQFQKNGFTSITLGERILRVETAVNSLLAQIELLRKL